MRPKLPAEHRISRARTQLLINQPWFGALALRLRFKKDNNLGTLANNGTVLYYDEAYVATLSDKQLLAVMAHEVMHCALGHMFRAGSRNFHKWNEACDIVINKLLRDIGFELPPTYLEPEEAIYAGMFSEQVYALRDKNGTGNSGHTPGDGSGCDCGLQPAPSSGSGQGQNLTESDWQIIAEQAAVVAKRAGKLPANLDRLIEASHQTRTDWRTILRRFIENTLPSDYSWMRPNRRYIGQGLYLPGMMKENTPRLGIAIDTSGSVDQELLNQFAAELTAILHETRPERLDVIYCDAKVQNRESFSPEDPSIILHARGGGGTAFEPALAEFDEDPPACVVYLTDGYGPWPTQREYPVLWAITEESSVKDTPWGEFVKLSKYR